jgi:hypothetical protein
MTHDDTHLKRNPLTAFHSIPDQTTAYRIRLNTQTQTFSPWDKTQTQWQFLFFGAAPRGGGKLRTQGALNAATLAPTEKIIIIHFQKYMVFDWQKKATLICTFAIIAQKLLHMFSEITTHLLKQFAIYDIKPHLRGACQNVSHSIVFVHSSSVLSTFSLKKQLYSCTKGILTKTHALSLLMAWCPVSRPGLTLSRPNGSYATPFPPNRGLLSKK